MAASACQSRADGGFHENNLAGFHQSREDYVAIQHQLAEMTRRMATMETNISQRRPFQRRSQSRGRRSPSRQRTSITGKSEELCYYHFNYGEHINAKNLASGHLLLLLKKTPLKLLNRQKTKSATVLTTLGDVLVV
ncbi:hypothetical protein K0M31_012859 [Melipona bicolor]|uniref:Uncharacterized protein n=1 Tax=Melipona bicolor TaxID=60889 RepID=A0AA40KH65_9HYME|nr:hypothetical protein K0M31_012859 [Melipona bicolor]